MPAGRGPALSGWHFLPRRPGTFAQYIIWGLLNGILGKIIQQQEILKWPFALRLTFDYIFFCRSSDTQDGLYNRVAADE